MHWLTLLMITLMLASGWGRNWVPPDWRALVQPFHVSCGLTVLGITLLRLLWWPWRRVPVMAARGLMQWGAQVVHFMLYAFLIGLPVCGWLMLSAFDRPPMLWGWLALPPLMLKDHAWALWLKQAHVWLAYAFAGLIALHAGAALLHHYVLRDATLRHMAPFLRVRRGMTMPPLPR